MLKNNYFIEGLQGAGKTTLVKHLTTRLDNYTAFREGDFSPVELAWCAYVTEEQYNNILKNYPLLNTQIKEKTFTEAKHKIICYTQILTDIPNFYNEMEKFEIYNGQLDQKSFENIVLERFKNWNGEGQIFECSLFQNIIENQMLYFIMTDNEILDFYKKLKNVLKNKQYKIIYLDMEDIVRGIDIIKKERSDDKGNELWFPLIIKYIEKSPYGKTHFLSGHKGLVTHLEKRRYLEHHIINEIFKDNTIIIKAKDYKLDDIMELI